MALIEVGLPYFMVVFQDSLLTETEGEADLSYSRDVRRLLRDGEILSTSMQVSGDPSFINVVLGASCWRM